MLGRICALAFLMAVGRAEAQAACSRPVPVDSVQDVQSHFLVVKSMFGPAVVESECSLLNPRSYQGAVQFLIVPPQRSDTTLIFIKSYRVFTNEPDDKIKMSRGDGWLFRAASSSNYAPLGRKDDVPYDDTVEKWNSSHSSRGDPIEMEGRLDYRWHAYADEDEATSSSRKIDRWKTRADFNFTHGTLTNYLIRSAANSRTPIPFNVGLLPQVTEFTLEFYSNAEGISGMYRFVRR